MKRLQRLNDISEMYCSYEVGKRLHDLGFDVVCIGAYTYMSSVFTYKGLVNNTDLSKMGNDSLISAPTHSLAILWLKINFGYLITHKINKANYDFMIIRVVDGEVIYASKRGYFSIYDANEAAFEYVLNKLITKDDEI